VPHYLRRRCGSTLWDTTISSSSSNFRLPVDMRARSYATNARFSLFPCSPSFSTGCRWNNTLFLHALFFRSSARTWQALCLYSCKTKLRLFREDEYSLADSRWGWPSFTARRNEVNWSFINLYFSKVVPARRCWEGESSSDCETKHIFLRPMLTSPRIYRLPRNENGAIRKVILHLSFNLLPLETRQILHSLRERKNTRVVVFRVSLQSNKR